MDTKLKRVAENENAKIFRWLVVGMCCTQNNIPVSIYGVLVPVYVALLELVYYIENQNVKHYSHSTTILTTITTNFIIIHNVGRNETTTTTTELSFR